MYWTFITGHLDKLLVFMIFLFSFNAAHAADFTSAGMQLTTEIVTEQNDVIWGFDFIDANQIIFTQRTGALKILNLSSKQITTISGVPKVWDRGQGGLLDVRIHPKNSQKIFITYSEPVKNGESTTAFGVADLEKNSLKNFKKIFSVSPSTSNDVHYGSRIEFDDKDHVFITVGDRYDRPSVQDKNTQIGKILRFNLDGSIPKDNPFGNSPIWTIGHRSPQGLSWQKNTKQLWQAEMGPKGGDEINLIKKGENYGWPIVTYGTEYDGPKIGEGGEKKGMTPPIAYWVPSISPSGIAFYSGDNLSSWKDNLFVGNLSGMHIRRLVIKSDKVVQQEELLKDMNLRFRNIRTGLDGWLYFSTDQGHIMRIKTKG